MENKVTGQNSNRLAGKTVVITGASSGVGRAAAEAFAAEGANVVLAARGEEGLQEVRDICHRLGVAAIAVPTDMGKAEEVAHLAKRAMELNGRIDIWVNNAGVMATGRYEDMPVEAIEQVVKTNLMGYMYSAREVLPIFKKQGEGIMINNISVGGWMPAPYGAAYSASKFGIRGMTECLQAEVSNEADIHIVALYPGIQRSTGNMHSAKYSGLDFKIPPTAANPRKLAGAMVKAALHPRKAIYTDAMALWGKMAYSMMPHTLLNSLTAGLRQMMSDDKEKDTNGNLMHTMEPKAVYGETMVPVPGRKMKAAVLAGAGLGLLMGLYALGRKR